MKVGISTASFFTRMFTENALEYLSKNGVIVTELFLESYCEYNAEFGEILKAKKGGTQIHSVHALTTQFEPQLYSFNSRAVEDSFNILNGVMDVAEKVGAKYYTFHGGARFKKTAYTIDYDRIAKYTQMIIDVCKGKGVSLAYENVHWGYYNYVGFFDEIRKRTTGLKGTLDIKQARQSGVSYVDYLNEMGGDIVTVHLSDVNENGKMTLPGKGVTDFYELFSRLKDVGFNGTTLLEVYQTDYNDYDELFASEDYVKNVAAKVFK